MNRRYAALSDRLDVVVRENNLALGTAIADVLFGDAILEERGVVAKDAISV